MPRPCRMLQLNVQTVRECRRQTIFVAHIYIPNYHHIHWAHCVCSLLMYINTSGPFTACVLAAEGIYPPASNNCDIWKEPLWFFSHLILVAFGQIPQVWHRAQVKTGAEREKGVKGSERAECCWWNSKFLCSWCSSVFRVFRTTCWCSNVGKKPGVTNTHKLSYRKPAHDMLY